MYKCCVCEEIFEEPKKVEENVGEFWGDTAKDTLHCCPYCGADYEEAVRCKDCGEWFLDCELSEELCEDCKDKLKLKYKHDFKKCFQIAEDNKNYDTIGLNAFLISMFTQTEIETILMRELEKAYRVDCSPYINEDEDWFIECVMRGGDKNEDTEN